MRNYSLFRCSLFLLLFSTSLYSQNDKALLRELAEENQKSVEALALYPSETRLAILEAAKYPEVLIKMNNARQKTAAAFRTLIEDFPRSTQEVFYEITRYPGMLQQLVEKQESPAAMREVLRQLPENQRPEAFDVVRDQMRTLMKINELDQTARAAFDDLIVGYPAPAQAAFRQLVALPEVLEILNEDLRFTVLIGDVYRADPAWVIRKTDSLNLAVARAHAEELEEWKKSIENDPQAQQELEAASREYAAEYGYDSEDYPGDDVYYQEDYVRRTTVVEYYYPWWFGYPWWYPAPCWYPYPWWYNWGFYYHHHAFVVYYMPSWHFMNWYFYHPRHHHHYSHLSSHFVRHYYGHRRSGTTISTSVGAWRDRNREIISEDWMKDNKRLPERMKEYGRFEEERQKYNGRNPNTPVTQEGFLEKNARKYPELDRSRVEAKEEIQRERTAPQTKPSQWAPRKEPAPTVPKTEPARPPKTEPAQKPKTQERPPRIEQPPAREEPKDKTQRPDTDKPRTEPKKERPIEEAKDYHRQKWEETKRTETQRQPQPATRTQQPKTQQPKATQPKTQQPKAQPAKPQKDSGRKN
ncbi:MAG: hypothetical protein DYG98_23385 [Haliscomenobacteraceae bacterium CHB4]|nr:hypothetical protein [Saprospiraceae bacterium]MCE7926003.1 hypothetical protein [Haliscomenobacteraceae bacterium CHB4]